MCDVELLEYLEGFISERRKERYKQILGARTNYITVAIEDVYQLHNTSAVIRSCEVFGVQQAHVVEGRFGNRLDKNIAVGAEQWVDINRYRNIGSCIKSLRKQGYQIIATTSHNDSCLLQDFKIDRKTAFLFGTEREGLSQEAMTKSDNFLKIPMSGFTESLNVSVSAAIILQHLTNTLRKAQLPWQLTEAEKFEKRLEWTKKSIKSIDDILARYER